MLTCRVTVFELTGGKAYTADDKLKRSAVEIEGK